MAVLGVKETVKNKIRYVISTINAVIDTQMVTG